MRASTRKKLLTIIAMAASSPIAAQNMCEWTEVWSDDFNTLDTSVWSREVNGDGGGNNELQYYTDRPENSWVSNGFLNIKAIRENYNGKTWTSARLRTKHAQEWTYGKIEARIKVPNDSGTWAAFWMLPTELQRDSHGWPQSGEIDIMESINADEDLMGTLHYGAYWPYNGNTGWPNPDNLIPAEAGRTKTAFNTYAVEWYEDRIVWLVNGQPKITSTRADLDGVDPVRSNWDSFVDRPFHIILNLAIGGSLPGNPDGTEAAEQLMQVDWVKVYKNEDTWSVEGDGYVYRGEDYKRYHVDAPAGGSYQWAVPQGASIVSGQGSNEIVVSYGNGAQSGDISVTFNPGCGSRTYSQPVVVEAGSVQVITDYESGLGVTHLQNGLEQGQTNPTTGQTTHFEVVANPSPDGVNDSANVLHYQRDASATWDNLKLSGFSPFDAGELKSGRAKLFIDVFVPNSSPTLLGHELNGGLENTAAVSAAPAWDGNTGRLVAFQGSIGEPGEWHTVELNYAGTPDSNIASSQGDSLVFMVDPSLNVSANLYFDNPRIVWPENGYTQQSMIADFEGASDDGNLEGAPVTSGNAVVVPNPAPGGINNSANVLQYSRDSGADYDTLSFNQVTGIPDALDAQHGMVRVAVDVYTTAPAGTIISLNLEDESAADGTSPSDWQVGRHSFYQTETSTPGQWETLEFNFNFLAQLGDWANNRASAAFTEVDQLIFLITPGQPSSDTYYFDNFRVMKYNEDAPACVTDCGSDDGGNDGGGDDGGGDDDGGNDSNDANVALGAAASASTALTPASNAVDGNMGTRWESAHAVDPSNITLDLGQSYDLSRVVVHWEAANAATYLIEGSNDASNWTTLSSQSGGTFGDRTDDVTVSGTYRYVRINGTTRSTGNDWGYSIWELEVYGSESTNNNQVGLISGNVTAYASTELLPASNAVDNNGGTRWESAHAVDPSWIVIDLASQRTLDSIEIDWEAANADTYEVQGSNDASNWTTLATRSGGAFGNRTDTLDLSGSYRYLRIYGISRSAGNNWGYSIFETRVYGY